ncbi:MAG: transglutaminase domain-containing protein [Lachnospiraceae bacterium]|nr:transglutaminase domain-containing protein [Lachnospiraceae bacterium]
MAFYYEKLTKQHQKAYHAMKTGLESLAPSFSVPRLDGKELADIYFMLRLDCPEIFYTVQFRYRYYPDSEYVEMIPEYLFNKNKILDHRKAMEARVKKLARQAEKLSEKEKEQFVHDFICENVRYDKLKKAYSHEIIGPLGQGVGVCEGIAKSVKILCDALGIWCMIAVSEANPEKNIKYRHAWNIVRIGGKYYHLDVTFDNSLSSEHGIRYDYFNLSDAQIFRDHEPVIWHVPACEDGDHTYYREKKVSFTKYEEVQKRAAQAAKKGKTLTFHWRGGYLTKEVLNELIRMIQEEAQKKGKYACMSLNWPQAVIQLSFKEHLPQQQIIMEEANEGETII